jgi:phenylalanyl-tRNA synthetase beta chain
MRVPLPWLRELCPVKQSAEELGDLLTAQGIHLERILRPWQGLSGVRVARVLEVRDHPRADRLWVATVEDGGGQREVVVGVRNMAPGDLVPYAPPGATLPGFGGPLERKEIRGVASHGMLCSPQELRVSADHARILVLQDGEPGADLAELLGLGDAVLDLEVVPNRPDLMSMLGVAREVAAATGQDLLPPDTSVEESVEPAGDFATVEVKEPDRCPRYLARVIRGVRPGASPLQAQVRLTACGMRPLSNVVDATNYVMLEMGQPMHPFDLERLAESTIVVRRAASGERLVTMDGTERTLDEEDLVIADARRGVAVAGVMGGGETEVSEETADVLLESAHFEPTGVLRTARKLGLRTEASIRFERGADPEAVAPAAARAAALIAAWSGGTALAGAVDIGQPPAPRTVSMRPARAAALLGMGVSEIEARQALGHLRLPATENGDRLTVEVPSYRVDLEREVDLIEEVGRVTGYDRVPSTLPGVRQAGGFTPPQRFRRRLRDVLSGSGLFETVSTSFAAAAELERLGQLSEAVRIANPVSEDDAYLRPSLVPGLLRAARRNVAHRRASVRLFEVGRAFLAGDPPLEQERVAVVLTGPASEGWPGEGREQQDFLDARGLLEHLLGSVGVRSWALGKPPGGPWHPGRSAAVAVGGAPAGLLGELHPRVAQAFDLPGRVAALELAVPPLVAAAEGPVAYRDVSRFPPVRRDVAFEVDREVPAGVVLDHLTQAAGELLDRASLFDVFEGEPIPEGKRSLAFALDLRAPDRTLTDEEADRVVGAVAKRLAAELGAQLRTG